jgi:hypothetical protein
LVGGHLRGEVSVEHVAAVVPIQIEDALAAVRRTGCLEELVCGRRRKDIAHRHGRAQAFAHVAEEHGEVARAPSRHNPHFSFNRGVGTSQDAPAPAREPKLRMGEEQALQHLVYEPVWVIDQFLHWILFGENSA